MTARKVGSTNTKKHYAVFVVTNWTQPAESLRCIFNSIAIKEIASSWANKQGKEYTEEKVGVGSENSYRYLSIGANLKL